MYKGTSRSQQRVSRLGLADLCNGDIGEVSGEEMRENLVAKYKRLTAQCALLPKGPEKKRMGQEIADVAAQISKIRPKRKGPPDLGSYFMDVARRELPKVQFDRWVTEATELHSKAMEEHKASESSGENPCNTVL